MPRLVNNKYLLDQPIYDTVQLPAAAGTASFFLVPLGGLIVAGTPKTYQHTNLVQAGTLEKGSTFTMTAISMYIKQDSIGGAPPSLVDYQNLMFGAHINLLFGQVSFLRLPFAQLPNGGADMVYFSNIAAAVTEFQPGKGIAQIQNRFHLKNPIDLDEQEAIQVDLIVDVAIAAVTDVVCVLWGDLVRPVR